MAKEKTQQMTAEEILKWRNALQIREQQAVKADSNNKKESHRLEKERKEIVRREGDVSKREDAVSKREGDVSKREQEVNKQSLLNEKNKKALSELKENFLKEQKELEERIRKDKADKKAAEAENKSLKEALMKETAAKKAAEQEVKSLKKQIEDLQKNNKTLENQNSRLEDKVRGWETVKNNDKTDEGFLIVQDVESVNGSEKSVGDSVSVKRSDGSDSKSKENWLSRVSGSSKRSVG